MTLKFTNMKKLFLSAALAAILCSCEEMPTEPDEPQDEPKTSTGFSFDRIEYTLGEGDGMEESVKTGYTFTFNNGSSAEQTYVFEAHKNIFDRVTFDSNYGQSFEFTDFEQKVKVPTFVSSDGTFRYDDGTKWRYLEGDRELRPEPIFTDILPVPPNHTLAVTPSFRRSVVTADYKLYLKGDEYGEERVVEGRFVGVFTVDCDLESRTFPME